MANTNPYQVTQMASTTSQATDSVGSGIGSLINNPFVSKLRDVLLAIIVTAALLIISRRIANFIKKRITKSIVSKHQESVDKVGNLVSDLVFYAMASFSVYIGFKTIGMDIGLLMGGLSIGIGFAFREILSNMIAGIMIFSTKEFKIGDIVQVSGKVEHPDKKEILFGKIEEITIRYIVIRTFDLRRVVVPSLKFITATVKTYTSEDIVRDEADFTIDINSDIPKTIETLKQSINTLPFITNPEYSDIIVTGYDIKLLKMKAIYAYNPNAGAMNHSVKSAILEKIVEVLRVSNFNIQQKIEKKVPEKEPSFA